MDQERIKELFSDETFVKSLAELETVEDVQVALKEKGVEITLEDINKLHKSIISMGDEELSLDTLEDVAGGSIGFILTPVLRAFRAARW